MCLILSKVNFKKSMGIYKNHHLVGPLGLDRNLRMYFPNVLCFSKVALCHFTFTKDLCQYPFLITKTYQVILLLKVKNENGIQHLVWCEQLRSSITLSRREAPQAPSPGTTLSISAPQAPSPGTTLSISASSCHSFELCLCTSELHLDIFVCICKHDVS